MFAFRLCPGLSHASSDNSTVSVQERRSHVANEGEISIPIAAVEIVEEDAADTTRLVAMFEVEILVAPFFVFWIVALVRSVSGTAHAGMETVCVLLNRFHRC